MRICEIFFSIQGEGISIGRPSIFIRTSSCNLKCQYCDTKYSWNNGKEMSVSEVLKSINKLNCNLVTITGGEPLIQMNAVKTLINSARDEKQFVIETNGTIKPYGINPKSLTYVVSPKLSNSGQTVKYENLDWANVLKFVITKSVSTDIDEVWHFIEEHLTKARAEKMFSEGSLILQPDGNEKYPLELLKKMIDEVLKNHYTFRMLPQLHRLLWGKKRGI